uniref:Integrase core domain-containing protein n=1 Tax=Amphimedon queenslandica TaxID=400682 RepID=A0A1X7TV99_AMPQE
MCGNTQMKGYLISRGYRVQQFRIRDSVRRVDMIGTAMQRLTVLSRRNYSVPRLSLYHIDSNHKLIRWKLVIHGCIDGFSRRIIYLQVSDNNRAETVLELFRDGVIRLSCVRGNRGGENVQLAEFMVQQREAGRGSFIFGRSVHNQRIERPWRDVFQGCLTGFYSVFYEMEEPCILDIDNELHLFVCTIFT